MLEAIVMAFITGDKIVGASWFLNNAIKMYLRTTLPPTVGMDSFMADKQPWIMVWVDATIIIYIKTTLAMPQPMALK
jgi:hypothetical protein